jgi:signal transduction histidine kinase
VFIREEESALLVKLTVPEIIPSGTVITAAGFPELEGFSATLSDAVVVSRAAGPAPEPVPANYRSFLFGNLNHELVTFTSTVLESFPTQGGVSIVLQSSNPPLRIISTDTTMLPARGTKLQITGICDVEASRAVSYNIRPQSISILARNSADVIILQTPSWWTNSRLTVALFALAGIFCLAILWIILLRRQVDKQTNALRDRIETEAMMLERQRIAREFHDTLEQDLTGLSLQLGAAAAKSSADPARAPLDTARHLVSRIQTETRNLLLDLRTPADQALGLPAALQALADKHPGTTGPRVELQSEAALPHLPPRTVHHLRMITQECVTNAIKHAHAQVITISLSQDAAGLVLAIADDGRGFDQETETWEKPGHFGCMGIRERSRKLGAEVTWHSKPGQGTTVRLTQPLSSP